VLAPTRSLSGVVVLVSCVFPEVPILEEGILPDLGKSDEDPGDYELKGHYWLTEKESAPELKKDQDSLFILI